MTPVEWYYARGNKQMGPVSALELKRLATAGELRPEDLVWREGMTEWSVARNVRGLFEEEGKPAAAAVAGQAAKAGEPALRTAEPAPRPPAAAAASAGQGGATAHHLFDVLLDAARPHFNAHFIEATARVFRTCGSYGLLVAMVLVAVYAPILAFRDHSLRHLAWGVLVLLAAAAMHYIARRSFDALEQLNRDTYGELPSSFVPDCVALASATGGIVFLLGAVATVIGAHYGMILVGLGAGVMVFLVCGYLAAVALNPAALNVSIGSNASASREALGVLTFLLKAFARLAPVAFGVGVVAGALLMGVACCVAVAGGDLLTSGKEVADFGRDVVLGSAALPPALYLALLLWFLLLDLFRAILSLPAGPEKPAEQNQEQESEK